MSNPRATDDGLTIDQVAKLTGISAGLLRVWELRYGFPRPGRASNGYRVYQRHVVPQILRLLSLQREGHLLKNLLADGLPCWPESGPPPKTPSWSCMAQLPAGRRGYAESFRVRLDALVRCRNVAEVIRMVHEANIALRPGDRLTAAWLPAYFGAREWQRCGRPLERDVGAVIARVAGPVVLADVASRWDTAEMIG